MVWRYQDFEQYKRSDEDYAVSLETSSKPEGDWPGYLQDLGWGFWAVDQKDPVLVEHGLQEWNRRLQAQVWGAANYPNPERVAQWKKALSKNIEGTALPGGDKD
jgi:hypothetical protein